MIVEVTEYWQYCKLVVIEVILAIRIDDRQTNS